MSYHIDFEIESYRIKKRIESNQIKSNQIRIPHMHSGSSSVENEKTPYHVVNSLSNTMWSTRSPTTCGQHALQHHVINSLSNTTWSTRSPTPCGQLTLLHHVVNSLSNQVIIKCLFAHIANNCIKCFSTIIPSIIKECVLRQSGACWPMW